MLGPRGQELAGGTAHQAGTLPPVTAKAGSSLRLQLNERAGGGSQAMEAESHPLSSGCQAPPSALGRSDDSVQRD